jgi:hypothetical protein
MVLGRDQPPCGVVEIVPPSCINSPHGSLIRQPSPSYKLEQSIPNIIIFKACFLRIFELFGIKPIKMKTKIIEIVWHIWYVTGIGF